MKLYLVRHCQTDRNRDGLVQGRADPSLNAAGRIQAGYVAARLAAIPLTRIYSSPLRRASETASAIAAAQGREVVTEPSLMELDVGEMDGLTGAEMRARYPGFLDTWLANPDATLRLPGGESLEEVQARAWSFIESLRGADEPEAVACVSHYFVLASLLCRALRLPLGRISRFRQSVGGFSVIDFRGERIQIARLNETCHLIDA